MLQVICGAFLDVYEEVGSVAGSAQRSDFWLTRRRGGPPRKYSRPEGNEESSADAVEINPSSK